MSFGIYMEGYRNSVHSAFERITLDGYKTKQTLERARQKFCEANNFIIEGYCVYIFTGGDRKYNRQYYNLVERFNCKAFFEFWT